MTSPPSPPNRRRRRIIVTVVVLAVGLCWWLWPRADQRFVGKWLRVPSPPVEYRRGFYSNGTGQDFVDNRPGLPAFRWYAAKNTLWIGFYRKGLMGLADRLEVLWSRMTGKSPRLGAIYTVGSISATRLELVTRRSFQELTETFERLHDNSEE